MTRPGFLVIGAQRAGTTWLDRQLRSHPQVWLPERRKEVHYFDRYYDRGAGWYAGFFPPSGEAGAWRALGEITPDYLSEPEVPERIAHDLPDVKLLAVLRNPVDRAYSQYALEVRDEGEDRTFEEFVEARPDALERGLYARNLGRYLDRYPRNRLELLVFERVMADPGPALARVASFLEIDPEPFTRVSAGDRVNGSYRPRHPKLYHAAHRVGDLLHDWDLDWFVNLAKAIGFPRLFGNAGPLPPLEASTRARLTDYFRSDVAALEDLLGESLADWGSPGEAPADRSTNAKTAERSLNPDRDLPINRAEDPVSAR